MIKKFLGALAAIITVVSFSMVSLAEPTIEYEEINPDYIKYWENYDKDSSSPLVPRRVVPEASSYKQKEQLSILNSKSYPSKFNLADEGSVTSIKNQGSRGVCWTFSANAMLESFLKKKFNKTYDFAEMHMDYATSMYCVNGEKYLEGSTNPEGINKSAGTGGNINFSVPYLFSSRGAVDEKQMPYNQHEKRVSLSKVSGAKSSDIWVRDYVILPSYNVSGIVDKGTISAEEYRKMVKNHLMNYGAIDMSMNGGSGFVFDSIAFYDKNNQIHNGDHAVTLVGWDDNYSKDKFKPHTPSSNGAWIIKNSWGTSANENGYFYMSYEDKSMYQVNAGVTDARIGKSYDNMYSHDEFGHNAYFGTNNVNTGYAMNVYKAKQPGEILKSVTIGFHVPAAYEVYVNPDGGQYNLIAEGAKPVAKGRFDYEGYKTVDLDTPVTLSGGDFAVVVKYTCDSGLKIPTETKDDQLYTNVKAAKGESYFSWTGKTWQDVNGFNGGPANCSIKAFTDKPKADYITYPSNITATPVSDTGISLKWTAVAGATKYDIYVSNQANGTYTLAGASTTNTFSFTSGKPATQYFFKLKAHKNSISSEFSPVVSAKTQQYIPLNVTGVSVPEKAAAGQHVEIKPLVSGDTKGVKYKYVWSWNNWQKWGVIYTGTNNKVNFKIPYAGAYDFIVDVIKPDGQIISKKGRTIASEAYTFSGVSVPQTSRAGSTITIQPTISGVTSGFKYKYVWSWNNWQKWGVIYTGTNNKASFKIPYAGAYDFIVDVIKPDGQIISKKGRTVASEAYTFSGVSVPQTSRAGNTITIQPTISGATSGFKYKYVWSWNNWQKWGVIYTGTNNKASFKIPYAGAYDFIVDVIKPDGQIISKKGRSVVSEAYTYAGVNVPTSSPVGNSVTIRPNISDNMAGLKYKFVWSYNNWSQWGVIKDISADNFASMILTKEGKYDFYIDVISSNGSITTRSASTNTYLNWQVAGISASATTIRLGDTVKLSGSATGGSGLKYKFVWSRENWKYWSVLKNADINKDCQFKPSARGTYTIYMDVVDNFGNYKTVTKTIKVV